MKKSKRYNALYFRSLTNAGSTVTVTTILFILFISIAERLLGQSPEWDWANVLGGNDVDFGYSIALGTSGNIHTTGLFRGTADFDPGSGNFELTSGGTNDLFISTLGPAGQFIMAKQMSGWNYDNGNAIAVDNAGNIYTSGEFWGTCDFNPGPETYNLSSAGLGDIFVSKIDAAGNFLWAVSIGDQGSDWANSLVLDASGNVYVTGWFEGVCDFDPGPAISNLSSNGSVDIFILKLDAMGNFIWTKGIGSAGPDQGYLITLDENGNVYTTGHFQSNADFDPGSGVFTLSEGGSFISKLNNSGNFIWAKGLGSNGGECYGQGLDIDGSGNVYSSGYFFESGDFDPGPGIFTLTAAGGYDIYVSKLDASGNFIWAQGMGGEGDDFGQELVLDAFDNAFITGSFSVEADFNPGTGTFNLISEGGLDLFISKISTTGIFAWAIPAGGTNDDYSESIAIDANNNLYITGGFDSGDISFGPIFPENSASDDSPDIFVSKLINTGGTLPSVAITSFVDVLCHGENTGSAEAQATGGTPPYEYEWSNGASGPEITNLAAGIYSVTATDNSSATAQATIEITEPSLLIILPATILPVSCNGGNNGSIQTGAIGGIGPYQFIWSNGETGEDITNLSAGIYSVTVTDDNGCTQTDSYEITQPTPISIQLISLSHESCDGENDGMISIQSSGGITPYSIEWSNGQTGNESGPLSPGEYVVTVTDNNDCSQSASYTINPGSLIEVSLLQLIDVSCAGGSNGSIFIAALGGFDPYSYAWSNGSTDAFISGLGAGPYSVTVTDNNECQRVEQYTIHQPELIIIEISHSEENLCFGDSTAVLMGMASGGVAPYSAQWSNGINGFENSNLAAGTYILTVTDANTCLSMLSDTILDPIELTVHIITSNETSAGANDGTAMSIPSGGVTPYHFLWNTGDTIASISGLSPGTYSVTIIDANSCAITAGGQVFAYGCSLDILPGLDNFICESDTIAIQTLVMGGSGVLSYVWSDGSNGESISVDQGGEYCVTITDEANCQDQDCVVITEIIIPSFACPATDESAPGENDGSIQCDSLPGNITYQWSNGATTSSIVDLSPGEYCVTVTEQSGCTSTQCFYVQPGNCQMAVNSVITDVLCAGDATGSISLTVDNGTTPLSFVWSHGDTTAVIENLPAGTYSVTVSDVTGCANFNYFTISEPLPLTIGIDSIAPADPSASGLIWITATGGTPDYTYQWVDPLGEIFVSEDLNNLTQSGNYSLVLADAAGCVTILDTVYVDQNVAIDHTTVLKSISVYPVPVKDVLIVNTAYPILEAFITGVDGRVYKHFIKPGNNRFDVADLGPGWYVLRMFDGRDWYVARMVK